MDTGAQCSAIRADVFQQIGQHTRVKLREVESETSPIVKGVSRRAPKDLRGCYLTSLRKWYKHNCAALGNRRNGSTVNPGVAVDHVERSQ